MNQRMMMAMMVAVFLFSSQAFAGKHVSEIQEQLKLEAMQDHPIVSEEKRISVVKNFAQLMKHIDDYGLGDARLFVEDNVEKRTKASEQLQKLKVSLQQLVADYHTQVKLVLLNNVKLKRNDYAALQNQGELTQLFFKSRNNHQKGKPITGVWDYKQDVSDSFFDEAMVNAGLKANFPELIDASWMQDALSMEAELNAFRVFFAKGYQVIPKPVSEKKLEPKIDGEVTKVVVAPAKFEAPKPGLPSTEGESTQLKPSKLALAKTAHIKRYNVGVSGDMLAKIEEEIAVGPKEITVSFLEHAPTSEKRLSEVHRFANALNKLDEDQSVEAFIASLSALVDTYYQSIKPILLNNVSLKRTDIGAQANRGDLIDLFRSRVSNHYTGKPVTGKLHYQKDVSGFFEDKQMKDFGLLVDHPELESDPVIQAGLEVEKELSVLLFKHREYKMGD